MIRRSTGDAKRGAVYLVSYGANPTERFSAVAHPNRASATAAAADRGIVPVGDCAIVVETADDVTLGGKTLLAAYNELTGEGVERFESRRVGVARFLAALDRIALPAVERPVDERPVTTSSEHEAWVRAAPGRYFATAFLGAGEYDVREATTLDDARQLAKIMRADRPVAVYAERGGHQVHLENYDPTSRDDTMNDENQAPTKAPRRRPNAAKIESKTSRAAKKNAVGEFKPVRANSRLRKIVDMLSRGEHVDAIAMACGPNFERKDVVWYLRYSLRRDHGIDHKIDEDGTAHLVLPPGKTVEDCVVQPKVA